MTSTSSCRLYPSCSSSRSLPDRTCGLSCRPGPACALIVARRSAGRQPVASSRLQRIARSHRCRTGRAAREPPSSPARGAARRALLARCCGTCSPCRPRRCALSAAPVPSATQIAFPALRPVSFASAYRLLVRSRRLDAFTQSALAPSRRHQLRGGAPRSVTAHKTDNGAEVRIPDGGQPHWTIRTPPPPYNRPRDCSLPRRKSVRAAYESNTSVEGRRGSGVTRSLAMSISRHRS
jgi:hypothetical protein